MKSFLNWLWSGFGTGTTAFRGIGMAICVLLIGVIAVYYLITWIVGLFQRKDSQSVVN